MRLFLGISFLPLFLPGCAGLNPVDISILAYREVRGSLTGTIAGMIAKVSGFPVTTRNRTAFSAVGFADIKTLRYRADEILDLIRDKAVSLAFTDKDISIAKREASGKIKEPRSKYDDFGIVGLANSQGEATVVSTYRLKNKLRRYFLNQ